METQKQKLIISNSIAQSIKQLQCLVSPINQTMQIQPNIQIVSASNDKIPTNIIQPIISNLGLENEKPIHCVKFRTEDQFLKQQKKLNFFNDDEPLIQKAKVESKEAKILISIKAQRSMIKLKQQVTLPAMVSLKTEGGSRTSVDLICVIDISGSMRGTKIKLVKDTMKYLLEVLTPQDRLSIVTFNDQGYKLCGLKCVTNENLISLTGYIDSLSAQGGTNICAGLDLALNTIKERNQLNKVTSIFLLSDGQNKGADQKFKEKLQKEQNKMCIFSIHSFGFGINHDQDLMTRICKLKDGNFYFIKQLPTLDQAFSNALGGIISVAATDVVIKLVNISKNLLGDVRIKKTYGQMWQKINDNQYKISIIQLISGVSKDYVFQIQVPSIEGQVHDLDRDYDVLKTEFLAKTVDKAVMTGNSIFKFTLLNQHQEIPEINQNIDVIENHFRVIATQAIKESMKKAEENKFEQAQVGLNTVIDQIQSDKKARKEKTEVLIKDLEKIKLKCASRKEYQVEGKKWMTTLTYSHECQNNFAYSNQTQTMMLSERMIKKNQK